MKQNISLPLVFKVKQFSFLLKNANVSVTGIPNYY